MAKKPNNKHTTLRVAPELRRRLTSAGKRVGMSFNDVVGYILLRDAGWFETEVAVYEAAMTHAPVRELEEMRRWLRKNPGKTRRDYRAVRMDRLMRAEGDPIQQSEAVPGWLLEKIHENERLTDLLFLEWEGETRREKSEREKGLWKAWGDELTRANQRLEELLREHDSEHEEPYDETVDDEGLEEEGDDDEGLEEEGDDF